MAAISSTKASTDSTYRWHGRDRAGKTIRGEMQAPNEAFVKTALRRQGIKIVEVSKARKEFKFSFGGSVSEKDVALFTRQLATMLKAGVPLIKAFDIVSDGASNPEVAKLLRQIKSDIETGMSLKQAFEKHPLKFAA
jgi:type IV pilus assembly protein PilC